MLDITVVYQSGQHCNKTDTSHSDSADFILLPQYFIQYTTTLGDVTKHRFEDGKTVHPIFSSIRFSM